MDAPDPHPAEEWPLPPSWMWGCGECTQLYKAMKRAPEVVKAAREAGEPGVDYDPMDSIVSTQIRLAHHIATGHPDEVPAPDPDCERCAYNARSTRLPEVLAEEHRARHLFAPPRIVGLM